MKNIFSAGLVAVIMCSVGCSREKLDPPLTVSLPDSYSAIKMFTFEADAWNTTSAITLLTEGGLAAGYECEFVGRHGELLDAMPILWHNGKKSFLPVPSQKEGDPPGGRVQPGNDRVLVGTVRIGFEDKPASWHPDSELGWAKPVLTVLPHPGEASAVVSPSGEVFSSWKKAAEKAWEAPVIDHKSLGFQFVGFDSSGTVYGNLYDAVMFGGLPADTRPARYDGTKWELIDETPDSTINDVNEIGQAVGTANREAVMWAGAQYTILTKVAQPGYTDGIALNDKGTVIIDSSDGCFVWHHGKKLALNQFVPTLKSPNVQAINNRGQIVIRGEIEKGEGNVFYLLTPVEAATLKN